MTLRDRREAQAAMGEVAHAIERLEAALGRMRANGFAPMARYAAMTQAAADLNRAQRSLARACGEEEPSS